MHDLKFKNNKFDVVICGWTMVYSQNEKKCADEIIRVSKNNSVIAIGYAKRKVKKIKLKKSLIVPKKNANNAKQILKLFWAIHIIFYLDQVLKYLINLMEYIIL